MILAAEIRKCIRGNYALRGFTSNDIAKHFPDTKKVRISAALLELKNRKFITYTGNAIGKSKIYIYNASDGRFFNPPNHFKDAPEPTEPPVDEAVNPASVGRAIMAYIDELKFADEQHKKSSQIAESRMKRYRERIENLVLSNNNLKRVLGEAKRMNETKDKALKLKQDKIDQLEAKLEHSGCIVQTNKPFTLGEVARIKQFIKK
jgi:hypothetical protein